jgi:hypothetical protein
LAAFQFHLQSGKDRKVEWVEMTVMLFLVKNSLVKRKCEAVRCRDTTAGSLAAKVRGGVFQHFHAVAVNYHSSMRNWLFGLPGRIICEQSP